MSNRTKGILCILGAALSFSLMNTFVHLSGDVPTMQKAFFRNFVAVIFSAILLRKNRIPLRPPRKRHWALLLARASFGTLGLLCNFYAVDHLNISDASMLNKMSPFFAILVSFFLLRESINLFQGGIGVAYSIVRLMSRKGVNSSLIVFVFSAFSCLVCLPFFLVNRAPMALSQLACLLVAGIFGCSGQLCITSAYSFAPARDISVYDYTQVIFSALLGWMFFAQFPDALSVLGYAVICGAGIAMFLYQRGHPA